MWEYLRDLKVEAKRRNRRTQQELRIALVDKLVTDDKAIFDNLRMTRRREIEAMRDR